MTPPPPPSPLWHFSENSSDLVAWPFPYPEEPICEFGKIKQIRICQNCPVCICLSFYLDGYGEVENLKDVLLGTYWSSEPIGLSNGVFRHRSLWFDDHVDDDDDDDYQLCNIWGGKMINMIIMIWTNYLWNTIDGTQDRQWRCTWCTLRLCK